MTTSVDNSVTPIESSRGSTAGLFRWLPLLGLVLYPVLNYGLALRLPGLILPSLVMLATFALGVYLYFGLSRHAMRGGIVAIIIAAVLGAAAASAITPSRQLAMMLLNVAMITVTTILIGLMARRNTGAVRLYLCGFVIVVLGGVAMNAAHWPDLMQAVRFLGSEWIEQMKAALQTAGYGADAAADMVGPMGPFFDASARLAPSATVMNLIAQFTIGFLWFLVRGFDDGKSRVKPFVRWRMPYALTPVLASVIVIRLIGNEPIRLVADNLLLVLSIFYCVGGLALVEYGLGRLGLPGWARAVAYIMLLLLGLLGYFLTVMLGFIDSFADWRKTRQDEIQLDKA